jgi:hypothetical protein
MFHIRLTPRVYLALMLAEAPTQPTQVTSGFLRGMGSAGSTCVAVNVRRRLVGAYSDFPLFGL